MWSRVFGGAGRVAPQCVRPWRLPPAPVWGPKPGGSRYGGGSEQTCCRDRVRPFSSAPNQSLDALNTGLVLGR